MQGVPRSYKLAFLIPHVNFSLSTRNSLKGFLMRTLSRLSLLISIFVLGAGSAFAAAPEKADAPATGSGEATNERNHDESWYWGFNLGGGSVKFKDSTVQSQLDSLKNTPGVSHAAVDFDLYFTWPLEDRMTALGIALDGVVDNYSVDASDSNLDITASLLAFTAQRWFSSNIGDGFFARGDIGLASTTVDYKVNGVTIEDSERHSGIGLRLGIGYSILLSNETRLPITLSWQGVSTSDNSGSNSFVLTAGLLF